MFVGVRVGMDSHNRLRGRGCSGVSARPSDAAWTAVSSLCTPTPTCTSRSYVWFRVRSVMVVAPPVGAVPGGRLARGGPRGPCPAERPCSHSAHLGKKVKDETTTHRGRTRSNEPIIEGSRYKKVEARRYKVQRRGELRAPPDHAETAHRRHSAHGRPQPSVITIRYPSRSYVTRYSTRGSPVAHAGRCSDALPLGTATPRCSSRRRGVFGQGTMTQTHNHVGVVEWSVFPGISICVLHMWLRVS